MGASTLDGIFQGIGYTVVLLIMCFFRELFGYGTLLDKQIMPNGYTPIGILTQPVGGFICLGVLIAAMQWGMAKAAKKKENKEKEAE